MEKLLNLSQLPVWMNGVILAAAGVMIWFAGSRLSSLADDVAERTGISRAFLGAIMLGGITSLPELSTTVTAAARGSAPLAVNNLIGGAAMQVAGAVLVGEVSIGPVGAWSLVVGALAIGGLALVHTRGKAPEAAEEAGHQVRQRVGARAWGLIAVSAFFVLVGGIAAASSADVLAEQTAIGANFAGFVLLALVTSLPEISTTVGAARIGRPGMAFSNIFGTNVLDLGMIFFADLAFPGAPVLGGLGRFSVVAALLGIVLTAIYLAGLIERRDRQLVRWGPDSILVAVVYAAGVFLLFQIR